VWRMRRSTPSGDKLSLSEHPPWSGASGSRILSPGHVTLGGTFLPNNYSTLPDPDTAERIVKDAYKLCPQLASGSGSGTSRTNSWRDIQIVSHNVGLRPARTGGMRLELENRVLGRVNMEQKDEHAGLVPARGQVGRGREVGCVHAYGIGPAG
jgi:D-amino-acid oxidase